jgi:Na+-transporting methylmalonyl-CoA/oxaloacetate decarboxylase gamma subunit
MAVSGSEAFGRRQSGTVPIRPPDNPTRDRGAEPASPDGVARLAAKWNAPLIVQLRGILIGVGIVILLLAVYVATMKGFGRALNKQWEENAGYPGIEDAYKRNGSNNPALERAHNHCKSRSDFVRIDSNLSQALDQFPNVRVGEDALAKAAFYVSCLTTEEPNRFCQSAHRTHLVAALRDYFRLMTRVREERMMSTNGPFAASRMGLTGSPDRGATRPPPSAGTDARIVRGLRTLIGDGYVSPRDLKPVLGPPGDLDASLRGVEARRVGCP